MLLSRTNCCDFSNSNSTETIEQMFHLERNSTELIKILTSETETENPILQATVAA